MLTVSMIARHVLSVSDLGKLWFESVSVLISKYNTYSFSQGREGQLLPNVIDPSQHVCVALKFVGVGGGGGVVSCSEHAHKLKNKQKNKKCRIIAPKLILYHIWVLFQEMPQILGAHDKFFIFKNER